MTDTRTQHKIVVGDSRCMTDTPDESVHLVVTSPPYWQLKDYENGEQIGFQDSYEEYINNLNRVWLECQRVLHKGCRLCVNIGDQFARAVYYGRYKVIPIRTEIIRFCETIGFDYMGAVIWQKVTTCNTTGGATVMGSFPHPRNGIIKLDYEFILLFKKLGSPPKVSSTTKERSAMTKDEWNTYFQGHWNFPGEKNSKHLAAFPEELPRRLIRMFSFVAETVLDPFLGSGTTSVAAGNLGRHSVGYEINPEYADFSRCRLGSDSLFNQNSIEVVHQSPRDCERVAESARVLPYIFTDPVQLSSKVDPRKMTFGSKVDTRTSKREDFVRVRKVLAPHMLELDSGLKIRLLGVCPRNERQSEAVEYLAGFLKGQRLFLRFDAVKHDQLENLLCYLYLSKRD
jgi:site-specific DNA-methyltransferase (adenine-specific)